MTTPATQGFGLARDGVPTVGTTALRDVLYPTPPAGFKVYNVEAAALQRWTGSAWVAASEASSGRVQGPAPSGGDDTGMLLAAIAVAKSGLAGNVVQLYPGTYNINQTLVLDGDCMALEGTGSGASQRGTVLNWNGGASVAVSVTGGPATNVGNVLRRLAIHNSGSGTVGLDITNIPFESRFEDVFIDGAFSTAQCRIGAAGATAALAVVLDHCRFTGGAGWGLQVVFANALTLLASRSYLNAAGDIDIGDATHLCTSFNMHGGSVEGSANTTSIRVINAESVSFFGTYFESDGTGYLIDVPGTAVMAGAIGLFGCRILGNAHGNATPYLLNSNLATATWAIYDCYAKGFPAASVWLRNQASRRSLFSGIDHNNANLSIASDNAGVTYLGGGSGSASFGLRTAADIAVNGEVTLTRSRGTVLVPTEAVLVSGVDVSAGETVRVTLTAGRAVGAPLNPAVGQTVVFEFTQGGAGGYAITWNAVFKVTWSDAGNTVGKISATGFRYNGTNWMQVAAQAPYV